MTGAMAVQLDHLLVPSRDHVTAAEFLAGLLGVPWAASGVVYRRGPHGPADCRINTAHGGRIVYWSEPDGHVWEILTESYARRSPAL